MYAVITAPPGSGKGAAAQAWYLAKKIDTRVCAESKERHQQWEVQCEEIEAIKYRNRKVPKGEALEPIPDRPSEPPYRTFRIAVNSSARAFIDRLSANGGSGLLFDTELKTLTLTKKQDWGDSEAYLKGFHNEPINIDRAGGTSIRIEDPCFAAVLTGMPEAIGALIQGAEDGLFSRLIHYRFHAPIEWRSQRPTSTDSKRQRLLQEKSQLLDELHRSLSERDRPLFVALSEAHWDAIDAAFGSTTELLKASRGNPLLHASVRRIALVAQKLACILAVLRNGEGGIHKASIRAEMIDVTCAIQIAQTYLAHAIELAKSLPKKADAKLHGTKLRVFDSLSVEWQTVTQLAEHVHLGERTVQRHLKELLAGGLVEKQTDKGPYRRSPNAKMSHVVSVASDVFDALEEAMDGEPASDATHTTETTNTTHATDDILDWGIEGEPAF